MMDISNQYYSERVKESLVSNSLTIESSLAEEKVLKKRSFCDTAPNGVCVPKGGLTSDKYRRGNENFILESGEDGVVVDQPSSDVGVEKGDPKQIMKFQTRLESAGKRNKPDSNYSPRREEK
ncbi:unnamed protein product [Lepeophtheirus salmonis]|uniref:(salmon louse) hypothetical protein n=1 Tax=Lepeophtheirus salmonis TaxID=72036 RepID=A0A7R8CR43_LEPSM|nr:unnamed protein product [Lepeophtheirus salmonis]CAF2899198.1 unnamed protein product [Lepeophtheirus salmonis]